LHYWGYGSSRLLDASWCFFHIFNPSNRIFEGWAGE